MSKTTLTDVLRYLRLTSPNQPGRDLGDSELLGLYLAEGDETAFGILVHRHGPMVLSVCRRLLGDWHSAEDAFQATFLILARRAARIRKRASLSAWLYGVARRIAMREKKQAAEHRDLERRVGEMSRNMPPEDATWQELRGVLDEEIGQLADKYQAPIILCYFEGRSYDRAAKELGWSKTTLAKRLIRARELLRRQLVRRGITLSSAALTSTICAKASGAPLGAKLIINTVKAAINVATGKAVAAGCLSARAIALAEEAMTGMLGLKAKAVLLVMALGLAVGGAGLAGTGGSAPTKPARSSANRFVATAQPPPAKSEKATPPKNTPLLDIFGDPLPDGALARLGTMRLRHGMLTTSLQFAPDGKVLASTGGPGAGICLWDVETGRRLQQLEINRTGSLGFSRDGKTLVTANTSLYLFDVASGKKLFRLDRPVGVFLEGVAMSPDGRTVAVGESGGAAPSIILWDIVTRQELRRLDHASGVHCWEFSPDGKILASCDDASGTIHLWDVETGKEFRQIEAHKEGVMRVAFSPSGKILASLGYVDGTIRLWDLATGKQQAKFKADPAGILTFAFSPDGTVLASGGRDGGMVVLWEVATGKELRRWVASSTRAPSVAFSPDGKVLATGGIWDHAIRLWDAATGNEINPRSGHSGAITNLHFTPDGRTLYSCGRESKAIEWDLLTGKERRVLFAESMNVDNIKFRLDLLVLSPNGKILARARGFTSNEKSDTDIRLWDTAKSAELPGLTGHANIPTCLSFSPDSTLLASSGKDGMRLWDVAAAKELHHLPGVPVAIFSPDGKCLACFAEDKTVRLWEVASAKEFRRWDTELDYIGRSVFSPDSKYIAFSGGPNGLVRLLAVDGRKESKAFGVQGFADAIDFSPSGRTLAIVTRGMRTLENGERVEASTIHLWEIASGQEIRQIDLPPGLFWSIAFAPGGRTIATGGLDSTILIWDVTGLAKDGKTQPVSLAAKDLDRLWAELAAEAPIADRALWKLVLAPRQCVPMLKERLQPVPQAAADQVARLIADLESDRFAAGQKAGQALDELGAAAEAHLRKALDGNLTLEVRQRIEQILEKRNRDTLRILRAIEVLEQVGSGEARQFLERLANETANPRVAQTAGAAVKRMVGRP